MNKAEFRSAYVRYCHEGGHGFDAYDIEKAWEHYQKNPDDYAFLEEYKDAS